MTTLITGAGLVGTSFAQNAVGRGEDVVFMDPAPRDDFIRAKLGNADFTVVQDDVRNLAGLVAAITDHGADTLLHTASLIGGRVANPIHNGYAVNIGGVLNVAEAAHMTGIRRVVHISTFGVYDWRRIAQGPVVEDAPLGSGTPYSNSKAAQELILEAYSLKYGFELIVLRPANVFGVGHFSAGSSGGQKVQDLVMSGITGKAARIPEEQTMAFVYVYARDIGRAVDLAATVDMGEKTVFNIGYDYVTSFDELTATIAEVVPSLDVEIIPGTPPVSRTIPLDVSAAEEYLGWTPQFEMEAAFADYAADLKSGMG